VLPFPELLRENFYVSFLDFMKDMKESGDIADWKALPYDWRLAFPNILSQGNASIIDGKVYYDDSFSTSTPYILQEIRALAQSSDTGKVTIIGHSMGGMLAKKILHDYADIASSTDTLILVDSPQLGTPQAIATMLHGTNENIPDKLGWFTDAKTGRKVAQNMKSVYTLLPSREYAAHVENSGLGYTALFSQDENLRNITNDPLFNGTSVLNFYQTKYETTTISTYDGMKDFLGGADGHSSAPDDDIIHPKRIQMDMLAEAQAIHDEIDNWIPPEKMRVVQIAGWGIPETIRGVEYKENYHLVCPMNYAGGGAQMPNCTETRKFDVAPMFTFDGDGTVVVPSQTGMATTTETYFVDLYRHNIQFFGRKKNRTHGSVLEVDSLRDLIENIVKNTESPANNLDFIKTDKSQLDKGGLKDLIRLSLHSPVKVDITDKDDNHVGISASSTPEWTAYDTEMPNSYYLEMGEGKYLGFPLEASTTIKLQGTGTGTFTLNLEQYQGDTLERTQTFTDIPVSTTTKATLVINTLNDAKELNLDQNGDGTVDSVVFTDENKETVTFQTLKTQIQALTTKTKPVLLIEVAVAEKQYNKKNYKAAKALLLVLKKEIEVLSKQRIKNKWQIEKNGALRLFAILDALIEKMNMNIPKK
jgi:pimeloyl-ACP methyl ester carboxylesterase